MDLVRLTPALGWIEMLPVSPLFANCCPFFLPDFQNLWFQRFVIISLLFSLNASWFVNAHKFASSFSSWPQCHKIYTRVENHWSLWSPQQIPVGRPRHASADPDDPLHCRRSPNDLDPLMSHKTSPFWVTIVIIG